MTPEESKIWLRRFLIKNRQAIPEGKRRAFSRRIASRALSSSLFEDARVVALFLGFGSEVDTSVLLAETWARRKTALVPVAAHGVDRAYFAEIKPGDSLRKTRIGPYEPVGAAPFPFSQIDLVFVPGLGFDSLGHRVGYGGGVYDRLLRKTPHAHHVGLFFIEQQLVRVPAEKHDQRLDWGITQVEARKF